MVRVHSYLNLISALTLLTFASCGSKQDEDPKSSEHKTVSKEEFKNYIGIKTDNKDTIFTNRPLALITPTPSMEDEEAQWKLNGKVELETKILTPNERKRNFSGMSRLALGKGVYGTEKGVIPEKPIRKIDSGEVIEIIEPIQKRLLAPIFKDNAQYDIQCLGPDQGLASRNIFSIEKDDLGFMWFGTDNGLIRYDGTFAKTYNVQCGLPENKITVVKKDKKGNLWLGTQESGIMKFDGKKIYHYRLDSIASRRMITDIEFDAKGDVWFTVRFGGLIHFNGEYFEAYQQKQGMIVFRPTTSITIDKNNRKWITGFGNGLYELTDTGLVCHKTIYADYVHSSFVDKDNVLYIGAWAQHYSVIKKDSVFNYPLPDPNCEGFLSVVQDKTGAIWGATSASGIYRLGDSTTTLIDKQQGISSSLIYTMYADDLGKIWIGTEGGGVCCFNPQSIRALNTSRGTDINYFSKVVELNDGGYLLGTDIGINYLKDTVLKKLVRFKSGGYACSPLGNCPDIKTDKNGFIYAAVLNSGIYKFKKNGEEFNAVFKPGIHRNETSIGILSNNEKWFSGMGGHGFYRVTPSQKLNFFRDNNFFLQNVISLLVSTNDEVWMGTEMQGVCKVKDGYVTYYNRSNGLPSDEVKYIYQDKDNRIWMATPNGLCYFNKDKFVKVEFDKEINQDIMALVQDKQNRYWITTDNGIIVLTPKESKQQTWDLKNYYVSVLGKQDGFINSSFTRGSILIDSKNQLVVGSERNLLFFPLENFKIDTAKPRVILETIDINGQAINYRDPGYLAKVDLSRTFDSVVSYFNLPVNLELPFNLNHLTFHYSAIQWPRSSNLKFAYYLEGLETSWSIGFGGDGTAEYRNLDYGTYKFHLKAIDRAGNESKEYIYNFEILRPWWHSWWARSLYAITLLASIGLFIKWRTAQLKKRQKELEAEVKNATIEILKQKEKIEVAHKDIKDSIVYAKRIQSAMLPSERLVKQYLSDCFIFYKPKDIVAGDFYWMEQKKDFVLFAAADCTGHGVPGAMVSVVCNNGLNRCVREFDLVEPGKILDKARDIIIDEFQKSEEEVKDGMDISLCALNIKERKLYWAGANNPVWLIRSDSGELQEIKGNKQPIGKFFQPVPFKTHQLDLKKGDTIYVFTDGLQDQFGGKDGKKFKASRLKELLLQVCNEPLEVQKRVIQNAIEEWTGKLEQIDDMCLIGVRV